MKNYIVILIFFALLLASCENDSNPPIWKDNGYEQVDTAIYNKDRSTFIHDYLQYIESKKYWRDIYSNIPLSERFFVVVDTILYSKDRNFLFVFYALGNIGAIRDNTAEVQRPLHYSCESVIGQRDSCGNGITFYENKLNVNCDCYREAMNAVENYYIKHYKNEWLISSGEKFGCIGFNITDSLFFERAPLFQKYSDSLYYFQILMFHSRAYKNMPDSIILRDHF